jgi:hypothetical protein
MPKLSIVGPAALMLAAVVFGWQGMIPPALAQSSEPPTRPKRTADPDGYYHSPSSMHGKTVVLPIGTTFEARIDQTISSEHSRNGQRFNLIVDSPVLVNGTDVVIPEGSRVIGEVVEALPAADNPRHLNEPKWHVRGRLRIKVSSLVTPDGSTYPLVAQPLGEIPKHSSDRRTPLGMSVGYMGTAASFEAGNLNRQQNLQNIKRGRGPVPMHKADFLKDDVMGTGGENFRGDDAVIRSLVLKKRDYYIYAGSPMTLKVMTPFKIGVNTPSIGNAVGSVEPEPQDPNMPGPTEAAEQSEPGSGRLRRDDGNAGSPAVDNSPPPARPSGIPADGF